MGFRKANNTPPPSSRPYAFVKNSQEKWLDGFTVDAYWIGRKNGKTTVSTGKYLLSSTTSGKSFDLLSDAIAGTDTNYGGNADFRWDGSHLWAKHAVQESMRGVVIEALDLVLKRYESGESLPTSLDGWYVINKEK